MSPGGRVPLRRALGAALALALLGAPLSGASPETEPWGCYDPMPGHPTAQEKSAFVQTVGPFAQEAERLHGVPAAGLMAIAAYESGFGWTHNALEAHNLFGYKHHGSEPYPAYTLAGQPASDPNDRYVSFPDWKTGVLFVASKLATRDRYRPAAQRYRADLAAGIPVPEAVDRWVEAIAAAGYCPDADYPERLKGYLADYRSPKNPKDPARSLYVLSPPTQGTLSARR